MGLATNQLEKKDPTLLYSLRSSALMLNDKFGPSQCCLWIPWLPVWPNLLSMEEGIEGFRRHNRREMACYWETYVRTGRAGFQGGLYLTPSGNQTKSSHIISQTSICFQFGNQGGSHRGHCITSLECGEGKWDRACPRLCIPRGTTACKEHHGLHIWTARAEAGGHPEGRYNARKMLGGTFWK